MYKVKIELVDFLQFFVDFSQLLLKAPAIGTFNFLPVTTCSDKQSPSTRNYVHIKNKNLIVKSIHSSLIRSE